MTPPAEPAAPVLAIAGGAGVMGAFFAELLQPHARACLLVDRFPADEGADDRQAVPPAPLLERLLAAAAREGLAVSLAAPDGAIRPVSAASAREVRAAPTWLLFHAPSCPPRPPPPSPGEEVATTLSRLGGAAGVRRVAGLLAPPAAAAVARATDLLLFATPFASEHEFAALAAPYAAGLRPGSLAADLLSLKAAPLRVLDALLPPGVGLLGMHPLFGRAVGDVAGLVVAVVPGAAGRTASIWQPWLLDRLAALGMLVTPTGAAEHDAAMSYVQALSHFALLCFAYTFVRANQDPTQLLPFRTPVFEPLLYLAARVAALARRSPEVYRAIQDECALPELRRLFVQTAQELLAALAGPGAGGRGPGAESESSLADDAGSEPSAGSPSRSAVPSPPPGPRPPAPDPLISLFESLGAPWSPADHREAAPYEHLVAMSGALTEPINALRYELLRSAGRVRALRNTRSGAVALGAVYVDPLHHDRVDLASRVRFHRFNLSSGALDGVPSAEVAAGTDEERRRRLEATLVSLPLGQVQLLDEAETLAWLAGATAPRTGHDDQPRPGNSTAGPSTGAGVSRPRYAGKARFELSLLLPDWLDDDCAQRLLAGRGDDSGVVAAAGLRPQRGGRAATEAGLRPVLVLLEVLLRPDAVLALRADAARRAAVEAPWARPQQRRRLEDRLFGRALTERHLALRALALDWLLAHGGRPSGERQSE